MTALHQMILALSAGLLLLQTAGAYGCPARTVHDCLDGAPELEILDRFVTCVNSSFVSFRYEYAIDDGRTEIRGSGSVEMQGDSYLVRGNGLEIFCNGKDRWTVDRESSEVVIESYNPEQPDYAVNPAALLKYFAEAFKVRDFRRSGSDAIEYFLQPASDDTGMPDFRIMISADGKTLLHAGFSTGPGTSAEFSISSFMLSPERENADGIFTFDVSALDDNYIVTDLR